MTDFKFKLNQPAMITPAKPFIATPSKSPEITRRGANIRLNLLRNSKACDPEPVLLTTECKEAGENTKKQSAALVSGPPITETVSDHTPLLYQALLHLSRRCDGAVTLDDQGFNGRDSVFGKSLAAQLTNGKQLTEAQINAGYKMIGTYKNTQLAWVNWNALLTEKPALIKTAKERKFSFGKDSKQRELYIINKLTDKALVLTTLERIKLNANEYDNEFLTSLQRAHRNFRLTDSQYQWAKRLVARHGLDIYESLEPGTIAADYIETQAVKPAGLKLDLVKKTASSTATAEVEPSTEIPATTTARERVQADVATAHENVRVLETLQSPEQPTQKQAPLLINLKRNTIISLRKGAALVDIDEDEDENEIKPEFVLDPSQSAAIDGLVQQQFACLTGAAGTGKTTLEKILVDTIENTETREIDIANYGSAQDKEKLMPAQNVNGIAFCAFTGKAVQQMKKNLPTEYHSRCMTIHSLLGFYPTTYLKEVKTGLNTEMKETRIFVPYFTAEKKLPWSVIIIDEASMLQVKLWNQLWDALLPDCRVYMIGDINQLPPVHGKSVFGYAMLSWPSYELTKIHRQKGLHNPIVDNAWRVLQGLPPEPVKGKFDMIEIKGGSGETARDLRKLIAFLHQKEEFNPCPYTGDAIIVPQNKDVLGQLELNRFFVTYFNPPPKHESEEIAGRRILVVAGMEKRYFAVADKVMATANDKEFNITNGMLGSIINITENTNYKGIAIPGAPIFTTDSKDYLAELDEFDVEEAMKAFSKEKEQQTEEYAKRAASSVIQVDFGILGTEDKRHIVDFATTGQVNSLMHAYASTCHKSQGSEYPTVIILVHSANHRLLYREWLYTAITRAQYRVVILYNRRGLNFCLNRQKIKGSNLTEKVQAFQDWQEANERTSELAKELGRDQSFHVPELPAPARV